MFLAHASGYNSDNAPGHASMAMASGLHPTRPNAEITQTARLGRRADIAL